MLKNLLFIVCMVACGTVWSFDNEQAQRQQYFEALDAYNLCYQIEIADRTDELEDFYTGMYELARRGLDANDPDCLDGRNDAFLDFINESIPNEK